MSEDKVGRMLSALFIERCHILIEGLFKTRHGVMRPYKKYITLPENFHISWLDGPRNIKKRYYRILKKLKKRDKPDRFQINPNVVICAAILVEQDKTISKIFDDVENKLKIPFGF